MTTAPSREEVEWLIARLRQRKVASLTSDNDYPDHLCIIAADALTALLARLSEVERELDKHRDFMNSRGYVRCDIPACNCDSWHGGHADRRLCEIEEAIQEAGGNTNGVILTDAILALGARLSEVESERDRYRDALAACNCGSARSALQHKDQQG